MSINLPESSVPKVSLVFLAGLIPMIVLEEGGRWKWPALVSMKPVPAREGQMADITCQFTMPPGLMLSMDKSDMPDLSGTPGVLYMAKPNVQVLRAYLEGYLPQMQRPASSLLLPKAGGIDLSMKGFGGGRRA